jgi:hypothetical protein
MKRAERDEVLSTAVSKLEDAAKLLTAAGEEVLADQANELADIVDVTALSTTAQHAPVAESIKTRDGSGRYSLTPCIIACLVELRVSGHR